MQEREEPAIEASTSSGSEPTSILPIPAPPPQAVPVPVPTPAPPPPPQPPSTAAPELRCEKCQQTFIHYARWQRHVAICTLAEDPAPAAPAPPQVRELLPHEAPAVVVAGPSTPSTHQPTITSVFHPKKFRRPVPLIKFVSKQGDEIEVDVVSKVASSPPGPGHEEVLAATAQPEVTIEPKLPSESATQGIEPREPSSALDAPGPSGSSSDGGTVVFLNREVTIRKLPARK